MIKKLIVVIVLLLLFSKIAYGAPPPALDIFKIIFDLEPGANVEVAYDMLGFPHKETWRIFMIPPSLRWDITTDRTIIVFLRDDSTINSSIYFENYNQMEPALQRYKELKDGYHKVFDAVGVPFKESEHRIERLTSWSIGNNVFGVGFIKIGFFLSSKYRVQTLFVPGVKKNN